MTDLKQSLATTWEEIKGNPSAGIPLCILLFLGEYIGRKMYGTTEPLPPMDPDEF
mgnify:CR=1 FL=1